ncbi:hypothetical protein O8W32_03320 [Methanomassiliicoccales archaeon LGM-DZ1]|nr:hypothetical protein O8W32_03320 [Methanomassiliicoccales archaeon LGM-DZ1]
MGINIALCETEAEKAPCRSLKLEVRRARTDAAGFDDYMIYEEKVSLDDARNVFPDFEGFLKRNRINAETDAVYMDKVKKDEDREALAKYVKKTATGWIDLTRMDAATREKALKAAGPDDRTTAWDDLDFDSMNKMCSECPLSWDKGRGCMGTFGPATSKLPEIARKYGCPIIGATFENAAAMKKLTPEDAKAVLKEVEVLKPALEKEGKMAVHRYMGPLERIEAAAKVSSEYNCRFYFF